MSSTNFPNGVSVTKRLVGTGQRNVVNKTKIIRIKFSDANTEFDTDFILPATAIVNTVYLDVLVAEATSATKLIDVGTATTSGGVPDGYMEGISVAATGLARGVLATGSVTMGALLFEQTGVDAFAPMPDIVSGGKTISWAPGGNDFAELVADIIINYQEIV